MLERDLPEIKDILNEEKEEISPIQKIMMEEIIRVNISNSDENNLLYAAYRNDPWDSSDRFTI